MPTDLVQKVFEKLKLDYDLFNYPVPTFISSGKFQLKFNKK